MTTVAAIATAPGQGGVGVIRLSGQDALRILRVVFSPANTCFEPRKLRYGRIMADAQPLDDVLAVYFPGPASYTGEDVVEIQGHGGQAVLQAILAELLKNGAYPAERGEFTRRAFLNGKMDLTQAEAVAEIIAAPGLEGIRLASAKLDGLLGQRIDALRAGLEHLRQQFCLAIDFPEDEVECLPRLEIAQLLRGLILDVRSLLAGFERARAWRDGAVVVLAGQVNVGKSSLMNALLGRPRAIVAEKPGTTRDYLEETTHLDGLPVRLIDTAGLRSSADIIELEGMRRSCQLATQAQLILLVLDGCQVDLADPDLAEPDLALAKLREALPPQAELPPILVVWNKADLVVPPQANLWNLPLLPVSAKYGEGIDELACAIRRQIVTGPPAPGDIAPNIRQAEALLAALDELAALEAEVEADLPPDLLSVRLDAAATHLAGITGLNTSEETLNAVFANFCIGK